MCLENNQISPIDVAQLGRQVVQISKTAHPIAKLVTPMCLPCACNHQKGNCLMIQVCLGYNQISPIDVAQLGRQVVQISKTAHPIAKLVKPMCLPCACNHQKSNYLMIRVCLGNNQISPIDVTQLGRQVVQISKTAHPIAKLVSPMCLPSACHHQKSNCPLIRVCFGNNPISPVDVAQLGREVVQISKTAHPIAKLVTPMCLASACHHQKSNCMMIRVCFGNNLISPVDVAQLGREVVQIFKTAHPIAKLVTPMCLPSACNHQKSNCLMIRVCLE